MSSIVKTVTPFINEELLLKALDAIGCKYQVVGNEIITDRTDYYGRQKFVFQNNRYCFFHDSSAERFIHGPRYPWGNIDLKQHKKVSEFLKSVEDAYNEVYRKRLEELERLRLEAAAEAERKRLEEERLRLERERQEYVEKQRTSIIAKAKEMGYYVQEKKVKETIKLVLVRTTY